MRRPTCRSRPARHRFTAPGAGAVFLEHQQAAPSPITKPSQPDRMAATLRRRVVPRAQRAFGQTRRSRGRDGGLGPAGGLISPLQNHAKASPMACVPLARRWRRRNSALPSRAAGNAPSRHVGDRVGNQVGDPLRAAFRCGRCSMVKRTHSTPTMQPRGAGSPAGSNRCRRGLLGARRQTGRIARTVWPPWRHGCDTSKFLTSAAMRTARSGASNTGISVTAGDRQAELKRLRPFQLGRSDRGQ